MAMTNQPNGKPNGRVTTRDVYDLISPLEARVRRLEYGMVALLVLNGGQLAVGADPVQTATFILSRL